MDKNTVTKIGGTAAIVIGAAALFISGAGEAQVTAIVGAVAVLVGVVTALFKK